jgi:hypothetical protein
MPTRIEHIRPCLTSSSALEFEAKSRKGGDRGLPFTRGKIVSLSIEIKVAIAVATGFVLMLVGAMAQG